MITNLALFIGNDTNNLKTGLFNYRRMHSNDERIKIILGLLIGSIGKFKIEIYTFRLIMLIILFCKHKWLLQIHVVESMHRILSVSLRFLADELLNFIGRARLL